MNSRWSYRGSTPRGLYLITPDEADTARLLARTAPLLAAGATWLQYRNKIAGHALMPRRCERLVRHVHPVDRTAPIAHAAMRASHHMHGASLEIGCAITPGHDDRDRAIGFEAEVE